MRLLWEEEPLDAIGAFCVGAFILGATWMILEGLLGASAFLAGGVAIGAAVWTLGEISRQRYPERRSHSSRHVPAGARAAIRPYEVVGSSEVDSGTSSEDTASENEATSTDRAA